VGSVHASLVLAGIYVGSRRLRDFDAALVPYAGASVFSAFGLGYRYSMWLTKPPTRLYWRRGWRLFFAPSHVARNLSRLAALFAVNIVAQRFIEKRSPLRWAAHWCLAWGCVLASPVTFPSGISRWPAGPFRAVRSPPAPIEPWCTWIR
jgi:hypothetical protein